jgi:cohesin complex subunit SA-1/2
MSSENGATASRRKSGRAVKAPEKFAPEAPSSPAPRTNGKRKREVANIEEEEESGAVDEENEDEDEEEEEEESADEETSKTTKKKAKPGRKPAAKKPKVNGTESHTVPVVRLPNRPKKVKKVPIADDSAEGLYGTFALRLHS